MFKFRFLTGRALMLAVLNRIEILVHHLERSVSHIQDEIEANSERIEKLVADNDTLVDHRERAARVAAKFRDLLA